MNKELIKKYKAEFDHWLDGGELMYLTNSSTTWVTATYIEGLFSNPTDYIRGIIINDEYTLLRKELVEGKTIQYKTLDGRWFDDDVLNFTPQWEYRIKPEEPKFKVGDCADELYGDILTDQQTQYPIFKRNSNGEVYIFTRDKLRGDCVIGQNYNSYVMSIACTKDWDEIKYDSTRNLYHLQPVWIDNYVSTYIDFYGVRAIYDMNLINDIRPITIEQLKTMDFIWDMYKQAIKDNK